MFPFDVSGSVALGDSALTAEEALDRLETGLAVNGAPGITRRGMFITFESRFGSRGVFGQMPSGELELCTDQGLAVRYAIRYLRGWRTWAFLLPGVALTAGVAYTLDMPGLYLLIALVPLGQVGVALLHQWFMPAWLRRTLANEAPTPLA